MKRILAFLLCCIYMVTGVASFAQADTDIPQTPVEKALDWLEIHYSKPEPGDEYAMLALLRGGRLNTGSDASRHYIEALSQSLENGDARTPATAALQGMALEAMGADVRAELPDLLYLPDRLVGMAAAATPGSTVWIGEESIALTWEDVCFTLLLFGGESTEAERDPGTLAAVLAGMQNDDGGFGNRQSEAYPTALVLLALAGYRDNANIEDAVLRAEYWQQLNSNENGSFDDDDGWTSPAVTSIAMLARACLGMDPAYLYYEAPSMAEYLVSLQTPGGGFARADSDGDNLEYSALCALALVAQQRYDEGRPSVFQFTDVIRLLPGELAVGEEAVPAESRGAWLTYLVPGVLMFVLAVLLAIYVRARRRNM